MELNKNRSEIFTPLLNLINQELEELPPKSVLDVSQYIQPLDIKNDARREVLTLFRTALETLHQDSRTGEEGSLTLAAKHLSLSNTNLAHTLNVEQAKFEIDENCDFKGNAEHIAISQIRFLLEFSQTDKKRSIKSIKTALENSKGRELTDTSEQGQSLFSDRTEDTSPQTQYTTTPFFTQMSVTLKNLSDEFKNISDMLTEKLDELAPPGPKTPFSGRKNTGPRNLF